MCGLSGEINFDGRPADAGAVDQGGHPERQGVDRQHHREVHRHQQPHLRVAENR